MTAPRVASAPTYHITTLADVLDPAVRAALGDLLLEYYGVIVRKLFEAGIDHSDTLKMLMGSFWRDLHKVVPPQGRMIVAQDATGGLARIGPLGRVRANAGEVKRLYVRLKAAGNGLGRAMLEQWRERARDMNLNSLLVNVISNNSDPMGIFKSHGFERIARCSECADPYEFDPHFSYMQHDLK